MVHNDEKLQLEGAAAFIGDTKFTLRRWTRLRKVPFLGAAEDSCSPSLI